MWENLLYSSISLIVLITVGMLVMQVINYFNVKKRRKYFEQLHVDLKVGNKVSFSNGLYGTIRSLDETTSDIEIKSGASITVSRYAISAIEK